MAKATTCVLDLDA